MALKVTRRYKLAIALEHIIGDPIQPQWHIGIGCTVGIVIAPNPEPLMTIWNFWWEIIELRRNGKHHV